MARVDKAPSEAAGYLILVTLPTGQSIPVAVHGLESVETFRRRIAAMPELLDASGAWSIHGWSGPKLALNEGGGEERRGRAKLLGDGRTLQQSGVAPGCVITPIYDSASYSLPVIDPDFYSDIVPEGMEVKLPAAPECVKDNWEKGTQAVAHGWSALWNNAANLCNGAGTGLAIAQDSRFRFEVVGVAPGGAADKDGRVRVGDVVVTVDGCECMSTHGLSDDQVQALAVVKEQEEQGGWTDVAEWERDQRAIAGMGRLEKMMKGPAGSEVELWLRRRSGEVYRVVLTRTDVSSLAASYF